MHRIREQKAFVELIADKVEKENIEDVKTLKMKIRPEDEQKYNSPWNIVADFTLDMGLNTSEIRKNTNRNPEVSRLSGTPGLYKRIFCNF